MNGFSRLDAALRRLRPAAAGRALTRLSPAAGAGVVAAVAGLCLSAAPSTARAQQVDQRSTIFTENASVPNHKIERKKGFNLFALGDLGVSGMKMTGRHGWAVTSYGPCSDGFIVAECGDILLNNNSFQFELFEMNIYAATPPGDFAKVVAAYPGAAAATGGGYSTEFDDLLLTGQVEIGPSDGSAGRLFSGVTSTSDNTCRDNTGALNGYVSTGFSLLPQSDCPETWAGAFDGPKLLSDTAYLPDFAANPATFSFTPYRVSSGLQQAAELAGNFSTYGLMSDHFQEAVQSYGKVTKAGADLGYDAPTKDGYPLGLDFRFDAFQFAYAPIQNTVYYQLLVINNSAKIYGTGIDYDSLYLGLRPGFGRGQQTGVYYVPSRNAVMTAEARTSGTTCNGAVRIPGTFTCAGRGFAQGASGIVILKSPIGDTRNKLFTAAGSPFNIAGNTNVHAGDTITFNHGHLCSYGSCVQATWMSTDKRAFGILASKGDAYLDGRDPNSLSSTDFYHVFRNMDFPNRTPKFNAYVPGNWDWNHDGVQDTLHFDSCGPAGCVKTWSDTTPGTNHYVLRNSNVGGVAGVGPIHLKAGDTTMFVFAFVGAPDSASFEKLVNSTTDVYNSFFLVPKPAPAPTVAVIAPVAATDSAPVARFTFTTAAVSYNDLFLANYANNLANNPRSDFAILNKLNPTLAAQVAARAANGGNLLEIQIYKSCDLGRTFTADATCNNAPLVGQNGAPIGTGFRPYAVLTPDANGRINNVFTDANVIGGKTYLYSLVTKTKGFTTTVIDSLPGVPGHFSRLLTIVDTTYSPLARNGPTTARVYVPISYAAGASRSGAVIQLGSTTKATVPISTIQQRNGTASGTYKLIFGNQFVIADTLNLTTNAKTEGVIVRTVLDSVVDATTGAVTKPFIRTEGTFHATTPVDLSGAVATTTTTTATIGGVNYSITTRTVNGTGFLLVDATGAPLFISTTLTAGRVTPQSFFSRADFPGFALDFTNANPNGTSPDLEAIVQPKGDTVVSTIMNGQQIALQYVETRSKANNGASGEYDFVFQGDAFGPNAPFNPNRNADTLQAQVLKSLAARPTATVADTSAATLALVRAKFPSFNTREFIAAKLPFTATNVTFGRPATIVVPKRTSTRVRIGIPTSPDTLVINVPDTLWIPGDTIFLVESMQRDSTVGGKRVVSGGTIVTTNSPTVTLGPVVLDCNSSLSTLRPACNPLALNTPAATGYYTYAPGTKLVVRYPTLFAAGDTVSITLTPSVQRPNVVTATNLKNVRVVPNPYVVQSQFDAVNNNGIGDPRIIFTGVPAQGNLRIYSVSGQFLQERNWTPADLNGTGDYAYDLRTREGLDLASGLYIYVIRGVGANGKTEIARGKFVIIR